MRDLHVSRLRIDGLRCRYGRVFGYDHAVCVAHNRNGLRERILPVVRRNDDVYRDDHAVQRPYDVGRVQRKLRLYVVLRHDIVHRNGDSMQLAHYIVGMFGHARLLLELGHDNVFGYRPPVQFIRELDLLRVRDRLLLGVYRDVLRGNPHAVQRACDRRGVRHPVWLRLAVGAPTSSFIPRQTRRRRSP
jgi:hypothetical protein